MPGARKTTEYGLELTYRDSILKDMPPNEYEEFTEKQLKTLLTALRKHAKKENWAYKITVGPSIVDPRTGKKVRLHAHILLKANPGWTVAEYIKSYWHKRYGMAGIVKIKTSANFAGYIKDQAMYVRERTLNEDALEDSSVEIS